MAVLPLVSMGRNSMTIPVLFISILFSASKHGRTTHTTKIPADAKTGPSGVSPAVEYMAMTGAKIPVIRFAAEAMASPVPRAGVGNTSGA
jgi:hypothetical protein